VHHSSEYYNQTTALRQSILQTYFSWLFDVPWAFFLPPSLYAVHKQFNTLFQYWQVPLLLLIQLNAYNYNRIHTEVIGNLGPLEYVINTPSAHRVHHGRNPYCIDKNYAGTLIIWDIFFGTFELERTATLVTGADIEPVAFGLTHPIDTFDPLTVQFHHLNHVLRTCWSIPGVTNKFKVLFYGPGWHDDTPRTGLLEEIPPIAKDVPPQKYDPPVSLGINLYVVLHFAVLIAVNGILLEHQPGELDFGIVLAVSSYIFSTLTSFGRMFDHKLLAIEVEFLRSMLVCVALEVGKQKNIVPSQVVIALQFVQLASGLWLMATQRSSLALQKKEIKKE
jgi:alkylglycerol monooxygenase